eukprot:TRINITY_DN49235_c0_g1_i1.p1 TRINITY_DN49235_c0_g1~~TRINITY_DN49235_c0_g1_i1.p1  ORF type:complete len:314 (-),score=52.52 TRINITY_DN49235_c0_g1_i1:32-973(-)
MEGTSAMPVRIGLIADVQHADIDDARSPYGATRHYRDALTKVRLAAEDWSAQGCLLAVNLGDTVDRRASSDAPNALSRVLASFASFPRVIHILGNHDLSSLPQASLDSLDSTAVLSHLKAVTGPASSFDISLCAGWRLMIINTYDIAVKSRTALPCHARTLRNQLLDEARRRGEWAAYLEEHEELNGAVGSDQLAWLRTRLQAATSSKQRVVVFAHASVRPEATFYGDAACWNSTEVSSLLDSFSDIVVAMIVGHDHHFGEARSEAGIYHRILEAAMEGEPGVPTHAFLELADNSIKLVGRGAVRSWEQQFES